MSELLPCPLCGSTNLGEGVAYPHASSAKESAMMCCDCSCRALKSDWQRRQVGWQPIETAPKDGTPVLLGFPDYMHSMHGHYEDGIWGQLDSDFGFEHIPTQPTHWMPLPPSPEAQP